ncbi:hypothetical protein OAT67_03375 [Bacteriovoracaceae bacterium]|nr:hypothetical protein [Bacteriovoracaceae bacterium]
MIKRHAFLSFVLAANMMALQAGNISQELSTTVANSSEKNPITNLSDAQKKNLERLFSYHGGQFNRPEACPLESKNYGNILSKVESIKTLFRDTDCLNDTTQLDEIISGATTLQNELDNAGVNTTEVTTPVTDATVNGQNISGVVNNLNNLFFKSKCDLSDRGVLEKGADLIQNFSQMGLMVPNANGLVISGGGFAVASLLRVIHNLFDKKFDFEDNQDRRNFIKLNCAFYDIRKDIESSGLVDISTEGHQKDYAELKGLIKVIEDKIKANKKSQEAILKDIDKAQAEFIKDEQGALVSLEKNVLKGLEITKTAIRDNGDIPAEAVKRDTLSSLMLIKEQLVADLDDYFERGLSKIELLDQDLKKELLKLDALSGGEEFMKLYKMDAKEFNNTYRAALLFHFDRIKDDIAALKASAQKKFLTEVQIDGVNVQTYKKNLAKKQTDVEKALKEALKRGTLVNARLSRIVGDSQAYTRGDDGTDNKTAILNSFDEISEQVYGKWGYKFLKYTTKQAKKENSYFKSNFKKFASDHLNVNDDKYELPDPAQIGELKVLFACQDLKPHIRKWVSADALSQQGYDFIATNKELFHSDIPRIFLGKTGGRDVGIHAIRSKFERIQDHHKSSLFARKLLRKEAVSEDNQDKYLGSRAKRKKFLGTVMLDVESTRNKAALLQALSEKYKCDKLTILD